MAGNLDVVRRVYAAFERRDVAAILELVDPEFEFWSVTGEEVRPGTPYRGPEGMRQYLADVDAHWDDLRLAPGAFEERGDLIVATGRVYARRGGRVVDSSAGWHWRVRSGRVVYLRAFRSSEEALGPPA